MKSKTPFRLLLGLLLAAFAFPPTEYVSRDGESARASEGFVFIGSIEGKSAIRYPQWVIELLVLGALAFSFRPRTEPPPPAPAASS